MALVEPVPFHFEMDWSDRFNEEREHETTIQSFHAQEEQRRNLSDVPNRRFNYLIKCLEIEHDELQRVQSRVRGGQHLLWWVPYWPRERYLAADVAIAATSVTVAATAQMALVAGQGLLFYRDPSRYEVCIVTTIGPTAIGVSPTTLDWRGVGVGLDKVVPCFRGYMAPDIDLIFQDVNLGSVKVAFDLDIHED